MSANSYSIIPPYKTNTSLSSKSWTTEYSSGFTPITTIISNKPSKQPKNVSTAPYTVNSNFSSACWTTEHVSKYIPTIQKPRMINKRMQQNE